MFFQFPLLNTAGSNLLSGSEAGPAFETLDLEALFADPEGMLGSFGGELQALLMQLSPPMQRRLEGMLASGMTLPQAANTLLTEGGLGQTDDLFANLLQRGIKGEGETPVLAPSRQMDATTPKLLGQWVENLQRGNQESFEFARLLQSSNPTLTAGATTPTMMQNNLFITQMPPQLASNLLHMGVPQQVAGKGWDQAIAERVMWMVQGDQQFARLKLNPPNLGPLEVRVSVNQDQTSVNFIAGQPAVRDALEAAMPRLREMFDQQSLQLVRADVSDSGAQQGERAGENTGKRHGFDAGSGGDGDDSLAAPEHATILSNGLVDLFA